MAIENWSPKVKRELFDQTFGALETVGVSVEEVAVQLDISEEDVERIQQKGVRGIRAEDLIHYTNALTGWKEPMAWKEKRKRHRYYPLSEEVREEKRQVFLETFGVWTPDINAQKMRAHDIGISTTALNSFQKEGPWDLKYKTVYFYNGRFRHTNKKRNNPS